MSGVLSLLREGYLLYLGATNQPPPPGTAFALFGHLSIIAFIVSAGVITWSEHKKARTRTTERHKAIIQCFERFLAIRQKETVLPFNALIRADAHQLETSDEVYGVCVMIEAYAYGDPFADIDGHVRDEERLQFLRYVRWAPNYEPTDQVEYLDAAKAWAATRGTEPTPTQRLRLLFRKYLPWD